MADEKTQEARRLEASKRRQAYWRRKRTVEKLASQGIRLATDRMTDEALWDACMREAIELESLGREGVSPKVLTASMRLQQFLFEIHTRGQQLTMFVASEVTPKGDHPA